MRSLRRLLGPFSGQVRHARSEALRFSPSGSRGGYFSNLQPSRTVLRSSGWTLALAAVGGGLAYAFGVNQTGGDSRFQSVGRVGAAAAPRYATQQQLEKAVRELRQALGEDAITTDEEDLRQHGYSEWSSVNVTELPVAVAYPKSTDEVSHIAKVCHRYRIPMIPYSGGSSLEANFSAPYGGISIDFAFMDKIISLNDDDMDVVVQPSVPWVGLNERIQDSGLFFPVDPSPSAKIGGMVGTSCSGTNAVRYGTMKDWVVNLTVVLADGTVIKTRKRPRKSSAGYNLTNLFIGSEGTLGLVTEITLKLAVIPQATSVAVVTFPSVRDAAAAASKIMRAGVPVAAMELMDELQMGVVNRSGATNRRWKEVPTMFFKFSGTKAGVEENIKLVRQIASAHKSGDFDFASSPEEQKKLWSARKESFWSMLALCGEGYDVFSTDVAVPLSRLADIIEICKRNLDNLGIFASMLGHVGDGNFHASILYNKKDPKECAAVKKCVNDMVELALEMEGTCTGEHGVGLGKKESLVKELGSDTVNVMKTVKAALDPHWLMNPGKIIDLPGGM